MYGPLLIKLRTACGIYLVLPAIPTLDCSLSARVAPQLAKSRAPTTEPDQDLNAKLPTTLFRFGANLADFLVKITKALARLS